MTSQSVGENLLYVPSKKMSIDVDAVNERLNGLVTLLRAVGIDSGDVGALAKTVGKGGGLADGVRQLDDDQIDAIIRKLQQAQEEAPQIIAALEAHAEARSLGGAGGSSERSKRVSRPVAASRAPPPPQETQEDESEEDDDDEDANYPMVGHGVSDDISVVSDLTTPTVVHGANIPDEEHYKDTLPPMIIGGGPGHSFPMMLNPSKRKNLVSSVRPSAQTTARRPAPPSVRPGPVSAAQLKRRPAPPPPTAARTPVDARKPTARSSRPSSSGGSTGSGSNPSKSRTESSTEGKKKVLKKKVPTSAAAPPSRPVRPPPPEQNWPSDDGWNAFESGSRPKTKKSGAATVIDTDGFLVGDVNFDPSPVADTGRPTRNAAGDLEVSQQSRRKVPSKTRSRSPKPERDSREETFAQLRTKTPSNSESGRPRRSRRASLAM